MPEQKINLDFDKVMFEEGFGKGGSKTATVSKSGTNYQTKDGFESGNINSIRIDLDGSVRGVYTNRIQRHLGTLAMA